MCFNPPTGKSYFQLRLTLTIQLPTSYVVSTTITVYHESFEAEKFHGFRRFCMSVKLESLRWRCSNMDLRASI